jgi:REP element-mobilizing transposase RayT
MGKDDEPIWYHVIWNTLSSWLPGDPRGFRNREHRIHSSGDYKSPPPPGEHEGLLSYNEARARDRVVIPYELRPIIADAIVDATERREIECAALSVSSEHVHALMQLPPRYKDAHSLIGKIKTIASLAVREQLPGSIWSRGCALKVTTSEHHWSATANYILNKQERGSYLWDPKGGGRYRA